MEPQSIWTRLQSCSLSRCKHQAVINFLYLATNGNDPSLLEEETTLYAIGSSIKSNTARYKKSIRFPKRHNLDLYQKISLLEDKSLLPSKERSSEHY